MSGDDAGKRTALERPNKSPVSSQSVSIVPRGLEPGEKVGRYVVENVLGSGGMGTVYGAHDPDLDRGVALKILHEGQDQPRLLREAKALAKLAHPNVITIHDVGMFGDRIFIAMERVEGITLRKWLGNRDRVLGELLDVLLAAGRGLSAAHDAGIVHRDFKPDNVVVGRDGRVRVLDFGIARRAGEEGEWSISPLSTLGLDDSGPLTESGAMIGTPLYMAPEQHRREPAADASDQFSYAVVLFEALYATRPFGGDNSVALAINVMAGRVVDPPPGSLVPPWLRRIILRGLSTDPADRYPTMRAMLEAIEAGLRAPELVAGRYQLIPSPQVASPLGLAHRAVDRANGYVVTLMRARIDRETFVALTSLAHPHLVGVLNFGTDESIGDYLVLDLREQPERFLEAARRAPLSVQLRFLVQILRVIDYLERRRIAHRSLTPDHVVVIGGQVKVLILDGGAGASISDLKAFGAILRALDPDPRLSAIAHGLTAGHYSSARDAARALSEATGIPLPLETPEVRESLLQTAPLVGRTADLARLERALDGATRGHGGVCLVGGESGAGKSRMLDAVRARALAHGALVLSGQEELEGGSPYRVWRDALRGLAQLTPLGDLEASVLLPVLPDLPLILGRRIDPAPELEAPSMHARVVDAVAGILRRQARTIVLLLEDLQWSRTESLKILQALVALAAERPILIVATYRNDERPELATSVSGAEVIALERLDGGAIAELSGAIAGPRGRDRELVKLLERQTEGNPFFVIEVFRALADEAGSLEEISPDALPDNVFGGGIRRVVERRLERVPARALPILCTAALIGRTLDRALLAALFPSADLGAWMTECMSAAVLEPHEGDVRFAHDKLREGLLLTIGEDERRAIHARIARAIEETYPEARERVPALAHHYHSARDAEKDAHYSGLAGELALLHCADREAVELLERALSLKRARPATRLELAHLHAQLGEASFFVMDFAKSLHHLAAAARALGRPLPRPGLGRVVSLFVELARQAMHQAAPGWFREEDPTRREELLEASRAAARASTVHIFENDALGILSSSLLSVNLAERAGSTNALSLSLLGFAAASAGLDRLARSYFGRMHAHEDEDGESRSFIVGIVVEVAYLIGLGRLADAEALITQNRQRCLRLGDQLNVSYAEYLFALSAFYRGSLDEARGRAHAAHDKLDPSFARHGASFAVLEAEIACSMGKLDEAEALLRAHERSFMPLDRLPQANWFGTLAMIEARRGDEVRAAAAAEEALSRVSTGRALSASGFGVVAGALDACLLSWKRAIERRADPRPLRRRAASLLRLSRTWARVSPIGWAQTLLYEGRVEWMLGREEAARASWGKGLAFARAHGLRFFEGLAHLELGHACPEGSSESKAHLEAAARCAVGEGLSPRLPGQAALERRLGPGALI